METEDPEEREWREREDAVSRFVVFVDMLGFAALTEQYDGFSRKAFEELDHAATSEFPHAESERFEYDRIARAYILFQRSLNRAIKRAQQDHDVTSVSFSDSAFIAVRTFRDAASLAVFLMRSLLKDRVPARLGIAHGDFLVLRFRADVSLTGGDHAAQFLGSAVVRAYRAEQCGIKGMRILLHPGLFREDVDLSLPSVRASLRPKYIHVADDEITNPGGVLYEINYLSPNEAENEEIERAVYSLKYRCDATVEKHYTATLEAMEHMRLAWRA